MSQCHAEFRAVWAVTVETVEEPWLVDKATLQYPENIPTLVLDVDKVLGGSIDLWSSSRAGWTVARWFWNWNMTAKRPGQGTCLICPYRNLLMELCPGLKSIWFICAVLSRYFDSFFTSSWEEKHGNEQSTISSMIFPIQAFIYSWWWRLFRLRLFWWPGLANSSRPRPVTPIGQTATETELSRKAVHDAMKDGMNGWLYKRQL